LFYDDKDFFQKSYRQIDHVRKRTENLMAFGCATVCETREREDEQRDRQADKTFLFCESFPPQPFLFFFRTDYMIPQTFTVTPEHIRFYFLVFLFYTF